MLAVIATDGSDSAIGAAQAARDLLREDADLVLVTIVPQLQDPQDSAGGFEGPTFTEEEAEQWSAEDHEAGRAALEHTAEAIGLDAGLEAGLESLDPKSATSGVAVSDSRVSELRLVESDNAGRQLCDIAETSGADVIVIGSSEKGIVRRLLQGSVMNHLLHHAPCPVLVVRHQDPAERD